MAHLCLPYVKNEGEAKRRREGKAKETRIVRGGKGGRRDEKEG